MGRHQEVLALTSHPRNVAEIQPFVEKVADRYCISPDKFGNILISLTEAVTNAIRHGNEEDESKWVFVRLEKRRNSLAFQITDQGRGFDFRSLPDPTRPENILNIGGRGVFLMRELSDDIAFRNNGSTVEIQFKL